jgi:hypothetical protein
MNIEERLAKYLQRDFSLEQAQILVLMELDVGEWDVCKCE